MLNTRMLDLTAIRVLLVEDNTNIRAIAKMIMRGIGIHEIKDAHDGKEALMHLTTFPADIIITDWMMDGMDGLELVQNVRSSEDQAMSMIPIIMMTGHTEQSRVGQARNMGVTEFLAKPISPMSLYLRIAEVIQRPRQYVRTETFYGPDRPRRVIENYQGPFRRGADNVNGEGSANTGEVE